MSESAATPTSTLADSVAVEPTEFVHVSYDANEIAATICELATQLGVNNPISIVINERTPLTRISSTFDGASTADATIVIDADSGALEDTKHLTNYGITQAKTSIGRMLLRARDRQRTDFADAPRDEELTLAQTACWDTYCAGRLERIGVPIHQQRWRYNHRNRLGFHDATDVDFDRLWTASDLSWADVTVGIFG